MVSVRLGFRKRRLTVKDISHSNLHVGLDINLQFRTALLDVHSTDGHHVY